MQVYKVFSGLFNNSNAIKTFNDFICIKKNLLNEKWTKFF